ncbi:hypothetical protein ACUXST_001920 [Sphingomonas sp. F9_3S_D5_B_2]
MITFILLTLAALGAAQPPARADATSGLAVSRARSDVCYALATAPAYAMKISHCLQMAKTPEAQFANGVCSFLGETGQLDDFGFGDIGACIRSGEFR